MMTFTEGDKMKTIKFGILLMAALLLSACAVLDHSPASTPLERNAKWAMLPIVNHTDVPQAGLRAEAITEALLRSLGVSNLRRYPPTINPDSLFEPAERKVAVDALNWAREQGVRYAVTGAVDEWRYKVGIDGEPAVGMTLQIIDLNDDGRVVWSAVGAKSGWSREALSAVAQTLIRDLLAGALVQ
jgi:TolB-like protein